MMTDSENMNPPNTATMISAGRDHHRPPRAEALGDREARRRAVHERLPHARGQEQLVVHREPEQDADQDHRQEAQDRAGRRDAEHRSHQPHWNTATSAPYVANSDSTKPAVAMIGTSSERNTTIMMSNESPTTTAR